MKSQFVGWRGDTAILAKSAALLTAATIPFSDVTITETFAEATKNLPLHFPPKPSLSKEALT